MDAAVSVSVLMGESRPRLSVVGLSVVSTVRLAVGGIAVAVLGVAVGVDVAIVVGLASGAIAVVIVCGIRGGVRVSWTGMRSWTMMGTRTMGERTRAVGTRTMRERTRAAGTTTMRERSTRAVVWSWSMGKRSRTVGKRAWSMMRSRTMGQVLGSWVWGVVRSGCWVVSLRVTIVSSETVDID